MLMEDTEVKGVLHEACNVAVVAFFTEAVSPEYLCWREHLWWTLSLAGCEGMLGVTVLKSAVCCRSH